MLHVHQKAIVILHSMLAGLAGAGWVVDMRSYYEIIHLSATFGTVVLEAGSHERAGAGAEQGGGPRADVDAAEPAGDDGGALRRV